MFRFFVNFEYGFDLDQSVRKRQTNQARSPTTSDYKRLWVTIRLATC